MAADPTPHRLGLGMDELRQLPVVSSASGRRDVGKRWWWARLGAMAIDAHFRVRVRANCGVSKRLPHAGLSHPPSGGKPDGSRAHVRFAGGPGALCWGAARQKILLRRHSPACLSTISPKPGITSRPCRPICVIREPSIEPFSLLLASLLGGIVMFGGAVLVALVLLERPTRKGVVAKPSVGPVRRR
jgi:hypothetical protein